MSVNESDAYGGLRGTASDAVGEILATGRGEIELVYLSLSERDPNGEDARYLAWHTLDHRPEQYRLGEIRATLRLVSTPACRAARHVAEPPFDRIDHVMTYFFSDPGGLTGFNDLAVALRDVGRMSLSLPNVHSGTFAVGERIADARIKAGADVLPWWPAKAFYLLLEQGEDRAARSLLEVEGVIGVWRAQGMPGPYSRATTDQWTTILFLDDDPVTTAARLGPALAERWRASGIRPLFAAPFHPVVPHEWDLYLP
jgi:hypothetical protein